MCWDSCERAWNIVFAPVLLNKLLDLELGRHLLLKSKVFARLVFLLIIISWSLASFMGSQRLKSSLPVFV